MSPRTDHWRCFAVLALLAAQIATPAADWVRPDLSTNQPVWGIRGGLLWAVAPGGFRRGEPRGLIRLGSPVLPGGRYDLVNFIAIEPIVQGRRGFSELERSELDGRPGKRLWASDPSGVLASNGVAGEAQPQETTLKVDLQVEKFENGAHVRLALFQSSARPDELQLSVFTEPDSAALDYCILTATMGNMARTRQLWVKDSVVSSLVLYADYKGTNFAPHHEFALDKLHRTSNGGVIVAVTNDEEDPASVFPFPNSEFWHYAGGKVTQYWRKQPGTFHDNLLAIVNGRYTYWRSTRPIPGGVAFENFELRERFHNGETSIFGITRRTPQELGFKTTKAEAP